MTRDQAADIIAAALNNLGALTNTLTPEAHAQRIATALDALGLLQPQNQQLGPRLHPPGEDIADISRNPPPPPWATARERT
jgi:hypothetical protein